MLCSLLLSWVTCIFWILTPCKLYSLQIFSPILQIVSSLCLFFFSLLFSVFWGSDLENHCPFQRLEAFSQCFLLTFSVSALTLRPFNHFELFMYMARDRDLVSFFCMWISNFARPIYLKGCPFYNVFFLMPLSVDICICVGLFQGSLFSPQVSYYTIAL